MNSSLRKALLVSTVGICGLVGGPVGASLFALAPDHPLSAVALAHDDGDGDHGGSGRGGDKRGGDDRGGDDRSGRSHADDGDDGDDHGGRNNNDNDDDKHNDDKRGRGHADSRGHHKGHVDQDDDDDRDDKGRHGKDRGRPEVELKVSNRSLHGLLNGSLIAVDDLGRVLEVEVEFEHGTRTITVQPHRSDARRKPGSITAVTIRPAE